MEASDKIAGDVSEIIGTIVQVRKRDKTGLGTTETERGVIKGLIWEPAEPGYRPHLMAVVQVGKKLRTEDLRFITVGQKGAA